MRTAVWRFLLHFFDTRYAPFFLYLLIRDGLASLKFVSVSKCILYICHKMTFLLFSLRSLESDKIVVNTKYNLEKGELIVQYALKKKVN